MVLQESEDCIFCIAINQGPATRASSSSGSGVIRGSQSMQISNITVNGCYFKVRTHHMNVWIHYVMSHRIGCIGLNNNKLKEES